MITGYSVHHILKNFIRMHLDDYGYEDVTIHHDRLDPQNDTKWALYRHGNLVGKARYDLNSVIIEIKDI